MANWWLVFVVIFLLAALYQAYRIFRSAVGNTPAEQAELDKIAIERERFYGRIPPDTTCDD